jgi:hypothetical protein
MGSENRELLSAVEGLKYVVQTHVTLWIRYCYTCYALVGTIRGQDVPLVPLPVPVDVIKHAGERESKSTAVHARVLAPDHVQIFEYPNASPDLVVFRFPFVCPLLSPRASHTADRA